jgi:hypothetical protein
LETVNFPAAILTILDSITPPSGGVEVEGVANKFLKVGLCMRSVPQSNILIILITSHGVYLLTFD